MKIIKTILGVILTPIFYLVFGLVLLVFHAIQWLALKLGGYKAHKKSVDFLNWGIITSLRILGTSFKFENKYEVPTNKPIVFVSNHQSMFDIPPLIWYFKKHHPKFVSKKELGKGIPSISFNLKHGGSVLIDRKNPTEAVTLLNEFGKYINANNYGAVIFPEGSRSRDGKLKPFKVKGLKAMLANIPDAVIVPVTINNTWKINFKGSFPLAVATKVKISAHKPILNSDIKDFDAFTNELRSTIETKLVKA